MVTDRRLQLRAQTRITLYIITPPASKHGAAAQTRTRASLIPHSTAREARNLTLSPPCGRHSTVRGSIHLSLPPTNLPTFLPTPARLFVRVSLQLLVIISPSLPTPILTLPVSAARPQTTSAPAAPAGGGGGVSGRWSTAAGPPPEGISASSVGWTPGPAAASSSVTPERGSA